MKEKIVIKAIEEGRIIDGIQAFKELDLSKERTKTLSLIEADFNILKQEILKGTIDSEQKELRFNRINDRLLTLLATKDSAIKDKKIRRLSLLLIPIGAIMLFLLYQMLTTQEFACPAFEETLKNKILLIPFENVGDKESEPHLVLRDRIEELSIKKKLSTNIQLGEAKAALSIKEAANLAESCAANVIIWGKYSNASDSLRLILQYHFLEQPERSKMSNAITLRDVTDIQDGKMFKDLEDSIMLLCSIIALRQHKVSLTQKWLDKVKEKGEIHSELTNIIKKLPIK